MHTSEGVCPRSAVGSTRCRDTMQTGCKVGGGGGWGGGCAFVAKHGLPVQLPQAPL